MASTTPAAQEAGSGAGFTSDEMMTVAASRALRDGAVCFVGIGLPSIAANLARATHAPHLVLIYESGTIGAKPTRLPLSIGDAELAETADTVVSVPEIFNYWLQAGRMDVGFLSAAQIDRHANLNSTVIGSYDKPLIRLPGAGGAPEIAASCREVIIIIRQSLRSFVEKLDFVTSVGHMGGPGQRERLGLTGQGPTLVITDLGMLRPHPGTLELELTHLHPGVSLDRARTAVGWDLAISAELASTEPPGEEELAVLRRLTATLARGSSAGGPA
ncbi:MAG TPA: CoA-transferase [Acidimicrobiales bacterium]|nr:CoA-transferase [Acidimicrobiales bacterium]